jgi:ferric-dicitrate binding protein FerR (iron transport regulator)
VSESGGEPAIEHNEDEPGVRRSRRLAYGLGAAAAVLAAVVYAVVIGPGSAQVVASAGVIQGDVRVRGTTDGAWRQLSRASGPIVTGMRVRATPTGRVALNLAGGASLRLDASTEATLTDARALELHAGSAYLDAMDDGAEPFLITTGYGDVRSSGGQLEVVIFEDGLRVRMRRGEATVERAGEANATIARGEEVGLRRDDGLRRRSFAPFDPGWAWVETLAESPVAEGESLLSFLSWVSRETGRELRFDEAATETRVRTTTVRMSAENMSPGEALEIIMSTTDFDYRLRGDGTIAVGRRGR